ncbi:hypothetical protein GTW69_14340, partial [Streptomyces sp. SID7760]|nr:hypothetical protein [Streptomyces sp. SID7760]
MRRPGPPGAATPLVVLSPGFTVPRATLGSLAEELASRGYVVASVDHAYESVATAFPGRILTCLACDQAQGPGGREAITAVRARDTSFLLDQLTDRHPARARAGLIDPTRIAMAGHSIGGATALPAMAADPRIRAGVDMGRGPAGAVPGGGHRRAPLHAAGLGRERARRHPVQPVWALATLRRLEALDHLRRHRPLRPHRFPRPARPARPAPPRRPTVRRPRRRPDQVLRDRLPRPA